MSTLMFKHDVISYLVVPQNILQLCFWTAEAVLRHSPLPSLHHPSGLMPWVCVDKKVLKSLKLSSTVVAHLLCHLGYNCDEKANLQTSSFSSLSVAYLSSRTESIGSTPDVSTTWSWSANRIAFSRQASPCLVRKSTRASRSSLSTRSAGIWAGWKTNDVLIGNVCLTASFPYSLHYIHYISHYIHY